MPLTRLKHLARWIRLRPPASNATPPRPILFRPGTPVEGKPVDPTREIERLRQRVADLEAYIWMHQRK